MQLALSGCFNILCAKLPHMIASKSFLGNLVFGFQLNILIPMLENFGKSSLVLMKQNYNVMTMENFSEQTIGWSSLISLIVHTDGQGKI